MKNESLQAGTTLDDLQRWWLLSLDPSGESCFSGILDYAITELPSVVFAEKAIDELARKLHKCPAQCPAQFRQWCRNQIDKLAEKINRTQKAERKGKPLLYEQHSDRIFVQLFDAKGEQHLWKFPASWLESAKKLWPCYVRYFPDKRPYVARKVSVVQPDGSRKQIEVAVHRLFLGLGAVKHSYDDAAEVESRDGSWTNFCDNNIRLIKGSDLFDHSFSMSGIEDTVTDGWVPAKAKVTTSRDGSSKPFGWHERSVIKFLRGDYPSDEPKIIQEN